MLYVFTSIFSTLSLITSAITITYPDKVIDLLLKESNDELETEEQVDSLSPFERFYLLISFAQLPMIVLMFFLDVARVKYYVGYLVIMFIVSLKFKEHLLKSRIVLQILTAIELFIAVDVIRSCISLA